MPDQAANINSSNNDYIDDQQLQAMLHTEIRQAGGWTGSELREAIKSSLDYFLLRNKGDEVDGRSKIQAGTVANIIDHAHAQLQPMYNVENLIEVQEEGPGDEMQSRAETEALNWYWRERLRGAEILDESIQDGLLSRNGYLKIYFEESKGLPYMDEIEGDELQVQAEMSRLVEEGSDVEVLSAEVTQEAEMLEVAPNPYQMLMPAGEQLPALQNIEITPALYRVQIMVIPNHREVKCESIAPEDTYVSRDARGSNMQQPRFVGQRRRETRQDIKSLGFYGPDVDQMVNLTEWDEDVKISRKVDNNVYLRDASSHEGKLVDLFECYFKVDRDRDGVVEMWKVFCSSTGQILHWDDNGEKGEPATEMVRVRPFASGSPMKLAHRHEGRSLWDKERNVEDLSRTFLRQMEDNLVEANNSTTVYARNIADEDIEETEVGRSIHADNPSADIVAFKHNNIVADSLQGLGYADKMAEERSGVSMMSGREKVPVSVAAHSTERIMSAMERVVAMYARNFANTLIRDAAVLLHEQLKLMPGKIAYQDGQEWAETEPRFWIQRNRITVNLGKSEGDKMREAAALREAINIQREDAQGGMGILVDYDEMYEARLKWAAASGLSDIQGLWRDPNSPEAQQQMQQDAEEAQAEAEAAQAAQQALFQSQMAMVQMQEETKRMRAQLDAVEGQRERLANLIMDNKKLQQKYVDMELEYQTDVPGEGVENGQVVVQ